MVQILEENEFFLVLVKPSGHSVHNQKPSLVEFLTEHKKPSHFVNRLDQETSGLMVIAQKPDLHAELATSLDRGRKFYRALLRGTWKHPKPELKVDLALTDKAEGRDNPQGLSAERKTCETIFTMQRTNSYFSEVIAEILTGRQHQIRKHSALLNQPIVGDNRYGNPKDNERLEKIYGVSRLQLHAEKLEFSFRGQGFNFENKYSLENFFK
jgi:23S rRNA-/tRNA-specific pseudouridylate synthase